MALPPVTVRISANIDDLLAKVEAAKAAIDDLEAKSAESQAATKGESPLGRPGGVGGVGSRGLVDQYGRPMTAARTTAADTERAVGATDRPIARVGSDTEKATKQLGGMRQMLSGQLQNGLTNFASTLKSISGALASVDNGLGQFGNAGGTLSSIFTGPLGMLGSLVGFAKTFGIMLPTLMAAPALLAAVGGAAGGLAGSFTVASTAIGIFAMGAMKDLGYITSVSNMAQYDALSAPLQKLYMAYHNLSNEFTIMSQTMGGNTTIISVLTGMFTTMGTVVSRLGPIMGEVASAGQSAFSVLSQGLLGPQFTQFINWVGAEATPVLTTFSQTFVNMASGWTGLMEDLTPAITLFDNGMVHLTATFANWANSPKGKAQVEGFINYVKDAWPQISHFWGGLGDIISKFFGSAAKGAPGMAQDLGNFFTVIANNIPMLVHFGDTVLPGIVKGFAAFAGGFGKGLMSELGPLLDKLSGAKGPNWSKIGDTVGKLTGDLLKVLPPLAVVLGGIVSIAAALTRVPGGIQAIVAAWVILKGVMALGQIIAGFTMIASGIGTVVEVLGGLVVGVAAFIGLPVEIVAVGIGLVIAAVILLATHWTQVTHAVGEGLHFMGNLAHTVASDLVNAFSTAIHDIVRFFQQLPGHIMQAISTIPKDVGTVLSQIPGVGGLLSVGGDIGSLLGGGGSTTGASRQSTIAQQQSASALQRSAQMLSAGASRGAAGGAITVQSTNNINVAGPMSPEALQQLEAVLRQHDNVLMQRLQQTRPAYG